MRHQPGGGSRAWMTRAACLEAPGLPWTRDEHAVPAVVAERMRATCGSCPVRLACAAYVVAEHITGGWWAGVDRDPDSGAVWMPVYSEDGRLVEEQGAIPLRLDGVA